MDYTDLQVNQRLEGANGLFFFRTSNAGKAESKGFEVELTARLSEGLDITASYGYVDAEYKDFLIDALAGVDYTGNTLVLSPKNTLAFTAQYTRPITDNWDLLMRGEASYRTSSFSDQANTEELVNDARTLVNARIGIENADSGIRVVAWVRNLFKEEYTHGKAFGSGTFSPGSLQYSVGDPRTYGVEVSFNF
jgi:iron complex outermembrane receptor protein